MATATKPEEPSVEELQKKAAARKAAPGLTPKEIDDLQQTYRDVVHAKDDDGKSIKRAIAAKLRRVTHAELHPECGARGKVEFNVPQHPTGAFYTINEIPYVGICQVWPCEARQLAHMVETARQVDRDRLKESGRVMDLDNPVAERVRAIQEA
jgi:hypothetical protein